MNMVASVSAWTDDADREAKLNDLLGIASVRDAYALAEQETALVIDADHEEILHDLFIAPKRTDVIVHEYALQTLRMFLSLANSDLVELIKAAVARMIVAVANASGEGWFGAGSKPTEDQRECICEIASTLELHESKTACVVLEELRTS
jgi:hypothetical protein